MRKIRVLVVDDSATIRRIVVDAIAASEDLELAGTAANGQLALDRLRRDPSPDVVTLDVEMPVLDGISTLKALRVGAPRLPVLMLSSHTEKGALATLDALAAGASDFVAKPRASSVQEARAFVDLEVLPRLRALGARAVEAPAAPRPGPAPARPRHSGRVEAVVIGVSTGGPQALEQVIPRLPRQLAVPVLVVQHMPSMFTQLLARRLAAICALGVEEAADGSPVRPGVVYVARGGQHLVVAERGGQRVLRFDDGPPENSCKPAADVLFRSAAAAWGSGVLAVVLTGMGRDGCTGCEAIRAAGGTVVAQDQETSVVWGMPGAVVSAGLADGVFPLAAIAAEITARVERGRPAVARISP